jgi:PEGA domain
MKRSRFALFALMLSASALLRAQSSAPPSGFPTTISWPAEDNPTLRFSLAKLQPSGLYNGQSIFVSDVTVQNLSDQPVPKSVFTIFIVDKDSVRVGRGLLRLAEIGPKQSAKAQLQFSTAGVPAGAVLLNGRTVALKIVSVPAGATLKIDGRVNGVTPHVADFTIGLHNIELIEDGYAPATSPLEVTGDEVEGGGISFELGGMSKDTVQLRDGTTVLGDLTSMSLTTVVVRVDGADKTYPRNQIRKIFLVERVNTEKPIVVQPALAKPK